MPNGFFLNRDSRDIVESIQEQLERGSYREPVLDTSDLDELLELHELAPPPQRIEKIDEFLEKESNHSLCQRLEEAKEKQVGIKNRLEQIHSQCYTNPNVPDTFRKNYTDGLNRSFDIQVFTPISRNMPTGEVPDFFEPFGVPVDAFERYENLKWGLQIVHGDSSYGDYKYIYRRVVDVGDSSFEDLKNVGELKDSKHSVEREYGDGQTFTVSRVVNEENARKAFERDWEDTFGTQGVVCSSGFDHTLRERLKEAMLSDEPDIICLYTGFLSDETVRKFVMVYFMETMFDIVRNLSGSELKKLDRQFIASMIEAQEVVKKSTKDTKLSTADKVFNRFVKEAMNDSGHYNFNFWVDSKPSETHQILLSKASKRIITRMNKEDVESWYNGDTRKKLKKAFSDERNYASLDGRYPEFGYGFIYMSDGIVEWDTTSGLKTYGHRLPCPRMCVQDPLDEISNSDWSFFTEELGMDSMRFQEYQDALFKEDWEASAEAYIEERERKEREKQKEKEEEEKTKKEMRKSVACSKLEAKVSDMDELPSKWKPTHEEILAEMKEEDLVPDDFERRTIENYTKERRSDLEENFNKGSDEDIDVEQVANELKTLERNGKPAFVYGPKSKSDKEILAKQYILKNHDVDESVAEDKAEEATSIALMDLKLEGIIDGNYRVKDEYEDPEEYKAIMGMGRGEASEQESQEEEQSETEDSEDNETEYVEVRITSEVPEVRGTDLDVYGPFEKDEVVEVPEDNADILVNRGKAEFVENGESENETSEDDAEELQEAPGEEWLCTCGSFNEEDRAVCRNPKCTKTFEEVEEEQSSE
ncbi:hypothetical protein [Halorarum halobium]|uniref:DNA replication complex subunit Gins51 n=1 Tax=Halorarum halobium TaxID=3075121 RepID=UPI0028AC7CE4|nr:hypothetical protein [Halobaculum sp. XH14]